MPPVFEGYLPRVPGVMEIVVPHRGRYALLTDRAFSWDDALRIDTHMRHA